MRPIYIVCLMMMTGCSIFRAEPEDPKPSGKLYFLELYNYSSHQIKIEHLSDEKAFISYTLEVSEDTVVGHSYSEEPILLFYVYGDSTKVTFGDDVSIFHTREPEQAASRSLFFPSFYEGGKVTDVQYIFSYEFTDADYEEAVLLGG